MNDYRKIRIQDREGSFHLSHMDEFIDSLLHEDRVCDTQLPRLAKRYVLEENNELEPRVSLLEADDLDLDEEEEDEEIDEEFEEKKKLAEMLDKAKEASNIDRNRSSRRSRSRSRSPRGDRERKRKRSRSRERRDDPRGMYDYYDFWVSDGPWRNLGLL